MKIQVGSKGEVAWDLLLDALKEEEEFKTANSKGSVKRCSEKCFDHRLILLLLLGICVLSYGLMYWITTQMYNDRTHIIYENIDGKLYHIHFSWKNCGSDEDPMKLVKLHIAPDPVYLDKNITVDLVSTLGIDINADHPISAHVAIERRLVWFWVKIPCVEGLGSCHYEDVCKVIPFPPGDPCPDPFPRFNIPCHCPISHGDYNVKNGTFNLRTIMDMFPLPHWLVSGDYYAKVKSSRNGKQQGCYEVYASVKA